MGSQLSSTSSFGAGSDQLDERINEINSRSDSPLKKDSSNKIEKYRIDLLRKKNKF